MSDSILQSGFDALAPAIDDAFGRFFDAVMHEVVSGMKEAHQVYVVQVGSYQSQKLYDDYKRDGVSTVASSAMPSSSSSRPSAAQTSSDHLANLMSQRDWEFETAEGDDIDFELRASQVGAIPGRNPIAGLIPEIVRKPSQLQEREAAVHRVPEIVRTKSELQATEADISIEMEERSHGVYRNKIEDPFSPGRG